jgi:hypothetical protein
VFMMKLKELEDGDGLEERKKVQKRNHKWFFDIWTQWASQDYQIILICSQTAPEWAVKNKKDLTILGSI